MMFSFRSWPPVTRLAALSACLLAVACAVAPKPAPPVPPAAAIPIAPPQFNSGDSRFDAFLMEARKEALAEGIAPATFDRATAGLRPIPEIVNMNANQPEFARPVWAYLDTAVSARRVRDARLMLDRYGAVLDRIEAQSGVPKEILVAIWGIETDYGAATGSYPLFAALATLAYRGPRADYARPEFLAALKIYQQQNYALSQMTGSWAGAFGQTQFTPTTFLKFAADGDGDGRIDLWNSPADALASAGRLLCERGWETGEPWGYEVRLPKNFSYELADGETARPVATWQELGVTTATGDRPARRREGSGVSAVSQFPCDPEIQQCHQLCPGCGPSGRPHGGRGAGAAQLAAQGAAPVARGARPLPAGAGRAGLRSGPGGRNTGPGHARGAAPLPEGAWPAGRRVSHRRPAGDDGQGGATLAQLPETHIAGVAAPFGIDHRDTGKPLARRRVKRRHEPVETAQERAIDQPGQGRLAAIGSQLQRPIRGM
jgi:lytic murein transglycosylase